MATKKAELEAVSRNEGCLGRSQDDEPVFILVARDQLASAIVRDWAHQFLQLRGNLGTLDAAAGAKYHEAMALAQQMDDWRAAHNGGKVPD